MRVAVQMDPILQVDRDGDTSYALMEAGQARGHEFYVYGPAELSYEAGHIFAMARPAQITRDAELPARLGSAKKLDLRKDVDVVLMRQDPPFDMAYLTAAHLLEMLHPHTLVVNDPFWVRSSPEKILPLMFPELMPPTLVSRDLAAIHAFAEKHQDIIVKPLNRNGGAGIFRLKPGDGNLDALVEMFFETSREPLMLQAFLPAVSAGDKRVILINGEPVGCINRLPAKGTVRANVHVGGCAQPAELDDRDLEICATIGPKLKKRGLVLVGIDVIGGYLTEINSTSPTCVQELRRFSGIDAAEIFWDAIGKKLL